MSGGGKAFADDSLTGLHLGVGLNVVADEYKSDVDVLGKVEYKTGGGVWTFTGESYQEFLSYDDNLTFSIYSEYTATKYGFTFTINNQTLTITKDGREVYNEYGTLGREYISFPKNNGFQLSAIQLYIDYNLLGDIPTTAGDLTKTLVEDVISKSEGTSYESIYGDQYAKDIKYSNISGGTASAYLSASKPLKARTNRIGGELKMSYFHNLTDHVVLGVDVCGTLNQKANKNIGIDKLNYVTQENITNSGYKISYDDTYAIYKDGKFTETNADSYTGDTVTGFFKTETNENNGLIYIPARTYTIESISTATSDAINSNPGYTEISNPDPSQYLQISNEKGGDVSFEKNKFNSRAAVVLGAQYKGWFAGVRGGVSYNQGKLHVKDSTGTSSEEVSFASPFVGVHLMKSVNMKCLENGHIYVTADVNVQNKQNLKMKGIKNFRQNSVNVSLGMTWQIN